MYIKGQVYFLILFVLFTTIGCSTKSANSTGKPLIVATTGMIGDLAKNLVGKEMEVISLMGPGVDPHLYKATQGDLQLLNDADIILYNGLKLEGKMGEILEKVGRNKPVVAIAKRIDKNLLHGDPKYPDDESANDPHIWFDVSMWAKTIPVVYETVVAFDQKNEEAYNTNTIEYISQLETLHRWVKSEMAIIPTEQRILITSHDAFGYFGSAYDLEVDALQGISTVSDFGLKDISNLVNRIVDEKIPSIFVESSVSSKSLEAVVEGCKDLGHEVNIGGTLFSDAMGEDGTPEGTYVGMVQHNVRTIVNALK